MAGKRKKPSGYNTAPNRTPAGRTVEVPAGITEYPGPRQLRRHRGCLQIRIQSHLPLWHDSQHWWATVLANEVDSGLVASGDDLHELQLYLLKRFKPVWFVVIPDDVPTDATEQPAPDSTP